MTGLASRNVSKTASVVRPKTTHGIIALFNLEAQIESLQDTIHLGEETLKSRAALVDLLTLRGLMVGCIAEYERAEQIAEQLARDAPSEPAALLARARVRALFHRFAEAIGDLEHAEQLSLDAGTVNGERAAILQALGRYEEARALREESAKRHPSFETLSALAGLLGEQGDVDAAEHLYEESVPHYRGVSPFPLAQLDFQRGLMWMHKGLLQEARACFEAALRRVPAYAPARGHLAEVEAQLGQTDIAISRLARLVDSSDDPDYAAQLARILAEVGRPEESRHWREFAATRYDDLVAAHPQAFADHAAEFWLAAGADPVKALFLARLNFQVRQTPRARELLSEAQIAAAAIPNVPKSSGEPE